MIIKCNIEEYYDYFINAAKNNNAPIELVKKIEKTYKHMRKDSIWKAPEEQILHDIKTKNVLAEITIDYSKRKESWYRAMKYIYENYSLL